MSWPTKKSKVFLYYEIPNFTAWGVLFILILLATLIWLELLPIEDFLNTHRIWIEIAVAVGTVGATTIALWPSLNRYFLSPKLKIGLDEKIGFVISEDQNIRKIQLGINLINARNHDLLIQRIIAEISQGDSVKYILDWNLFIIDYFGKGTAPKGRPAPIAIAPNSSHYEMIQFFREKPIKLVPGHYLLRVRMWANQESITQNPRFDSGYKFIVGQLDVDLINKEKQEIAQGKEPRWRLVHIPLERWDLRNL